MIEKDKTQIDKMGQSRLYVLFYSFFLLPLMITIFGVMFFLIVQFLTVESQDPYDLLSEIEYGSASKRWQSAYELVGIISSGNCDVCKADKFRSRVIKIHNKSDYEDYRVKLYLGRFK